MPSTLLTVAISAGLALAAAVKVLLTFAWRRLTAREGSTGEPGWQPGYAAARCQKA
jgi:hypothetical protein